MQGNGQQAEGTLQTNYFLFRQVCTRRGWKTFSKLDFRDGWPLMVSGWCSDCIVEIKPAWFFCTVFNNLGQNFYAFLVLCIFSFAENYCKHRIHWGRVVLKSHDLRHHNFCASLYWFNWRAGERRTLSSCYSGSDIKKHDMFVIHCWPSTCTLNT